ncbi:MAG: FAD-binding oxidoreductase [Candidatus Thermoplasmatota archaeon]|nr:FAD-binding oxidoreductase [Candidatus Thermoplasmatota archaeon]
MSYGVVYKKDKKHSVFDRKIVDKLNKIVPDGVSEKEVDKITYSKDYMPITLRWLIDGKIAALPDCIVWPESTKQISDILKLACKEKTPIIPYGDGSGVVGGAVPIKGGIVVDLKKMDKVVNIDDLGLTITAQTGINGMNLERHLNRYGYTMGHIPQSLYCSSLGGWIACKAAGQFSTKYGKIEDMLVALEAVLPDGTVIKSKPVPRSSTGPAVERLFLGSEGNLGIVTQATLKIWPYPEERAMCSYAFDDLSKALEAVRKIMRRNVYPAVVRIYDRNETLRHFYKHPETKGKIMLVLLMEGDKKLVKLEEEISEAVCKKEGGISCGDAPVEHWIKSRFNVRETSDFTPRGFIFDTVEMSVGWKNALDLYSRVIPAMRKIRGIAVASAHASHFYPQGVCFYFTFGGVPPKNVDPFEFYQSIWDAMMKACLEENGSISHHHGIGLMRAKWLEKEMGERMKLFRAIKETLDPHNIMNPGKMGVEK